MGTDASTIADGVTLEGEVGDAPRRALVVQHRDGLEVVPLVPGQPITIGRTEPSDIRPRSKRLSRRHARFELVDGDAWVEDLASTNGTFVNGRRIEGRVRIRVGDEVTFGSVTVSVIGVEDPWLKPLGLEGHERFQAIVESELDRARTFGRPVAVLMVRVHDPQGPKVVSWVPRLVEQLRMIDRVALYAPDCVEILLPEADTAHAVTTAQDLVQSLADHAKLVCGVAVWPEGGTTAEVLVEAARASVVRATAERAVVLYRPAGAADDPTTHDTDAVPIDGVGPVIGDPAMVALYRTVERIAASSISVLIVGETGTGKELIARAIHERSERSAGPMRVINCGAIPETLVESILFGHERGAFTGADQRRTGIFEEADGGTVFLDEIGELSLQAQVALLRVLETRKIQRVGSSREVPIDVRVIAATHRDLEQMCQENRFRWDLLYRLNPITLRVPPLRERPSEIRPMVLHFVRESNRTNGRHVRGIASDALARLERYHWPGNVRELRNTIERAVVIASGDLISVEDLPERIVNQVAQATGWLGDASTPTLAPRVDDPPTTLDLKERLRAHEIQLIRAALHHAQGNQTQAARLLQIPRRTLVYKMRAYGIRSGDPRAVLPDEVDRRGRPVQFNERIERFERGLIEEALARSGGDQNGAARLLNIQKRTLLTKLERHGLA